MAVVQQQIIPAITFLPRDHSGFQLTAISVKQGTLTKLRALGTVLGTMQ